MSHFCGRSPQGECGLKYCVSLVLSCACQSLPARGVWIEITVTLLIVTPDWSRSPQGECGLKFRDRQTAAERDSRSPQGECGLKLLVVGGFQQADGSLPARGVWIEIIARPLSGLLRTVAPRKGSVD